ncbi:hypothetical protein [Agromyces humatus]|nr:hypothetical protein [Agromyces humatus]
MLHIAQQEAAICTLHMQSMPPRCGGGVPVAGLDTVVIPSGLLATYYGVTWGDARLVGTFEDGTLTLTRDPLPPLKLDASPAEVIPTEPANAAELAKIAETIAHSNRSDVLVVESSDGQVHVLVPLEIGDELQASFDAEFGTGVVVVNSWLQPWKG